MKPKYLFKKLIYGLMGYYYEEDDNGYFISNGYKDFSVSFKPSTIEPKD